MNQVFHGSLLCLLLALPLLGYIVQLVLPKISMRHSFESDFFGETPTSNLSRRTCLNGTWTCDKLKFGLKEPVAGSAANGQ